MTGIKKERNTFYITHSGELLIWLIVILVIVSISTVIYSKNIQTDNDYTIFMNDVDGLIVGSPVRMMGIEVGHITKIKPTNEEIYVKFIITDKTVLIPQGTVATVEFKNIPILTVNPPKRLHDAAGLLNDMFEKLGSIIYTSSSFSKKLKYIDIPYEGEQDINKFLKYADDMLEDSTRKANNLNEKLQKYKRGKSNDGAK